MSLTPVQLYQQLISNGELTPDEQQAQLMTYFDELYQQLRQRKTHWTTKLFGRGKTINGLYLWGGVGIGKTRLMDIFYDSLEECKKMRTHFHRFMKNIHDELRRYQGKSDPLKIIAKDIAKQAEIICFDEFFVVEITDAMILAGLLKALNDEGVILVITSNVAPDDLYRNGLQRARFIPAIELIKATMTIVDVAITTDYRLRALTQAGVYFHPLNEHSQLSMHHQFTTIVGQHAKFNETISIAGRDIATIAYGNDVVWFDFNVICHSPRSQVDYIEIAHCYHTVFVSNLMQIRDRELDKVRYLINLVDVFYDASVNLVISAEVPILDIYPKGFCFFEFQRTQSRLLEMQSHEYLRRHHEHDAGYYNDVISAS